MAEAPRSQYNIQISKTAERDQTKAESPSLERKSEQQDFSQQQQQKYKSIPHGTKPGKRSMYDKYGRRRMRPRDSGSYRLLCALFGFIQGVFAVIPTTFLLSTFNTAIAAFYVPRTSIRTAFAILNSTVLGTTAKLVLLALLPFASLAWPIVTLCNSIFCGFVLGLLGPIFHVLSGRHILLGGVAGVLWNAFNIIRQFWLMHGLTEEEIMNIIHIIINVLNDFKILLTQFWQTGQTDKLDTIKSSPPLQALLRGYDWLLATTFPSQVHKPTADY